MSDSGHTLDINATFRGGGRSIEWLDEINKACIVMLAETGIVPKDVAKRIAKGIAQVIENEKTGKDGTTRRTSADYLDYEPRLIAVAGQEASRLHTGRSRQDLASTIARMNLRDGLLHTIGALIADREKLLKRAEEHIETIIPAYTHGVQAQPTTFAHYLLAFEGALARATERLQQAYTRVNQCPLGTALGVFIEVHAQAVGAEFHEPFGQRLGVEGLREVLGLADENGVVAGTQLFGLVGLALGYEVDAADRFELGVERPDMERVLRAGLAGEGDGAFSHRIP